MLNCFLKQVNSAALLADIGFKTKVGLDDALNIVGLWKKSNTPFKARYYDPYLF